METGQTDINAKCFVSFATRDRVAKGVDLTTLRNMCLPNCTSNHSLRLNSTSSENCTVFDGSSLSGKYIKTFAYILIMLVSLFGNLAVIVVVARNKRMWTPTNILIANVAASDLLISTFAIPRELVEIFAGRERWLIDGTTGLILCKFVFFFQDISIAVSIESLMVIAIDRYRGIVFPFRPPLITARVCKVLIPIIWIVAMCLHAPYFYTARLVMRDNKQYCTFSWAPKFDERQTQEGYFALVVIFFVFLPVSVILTLYTLIVFELKRKVQDSGALDVRRQRLKQDAAIMKRILIIVLILVLCTTPITVSALVFYFAWDWQLPCGMDILLSAAKFVLYLNASLNPCVYIVLSEKYRQGLKDLARCCSFNGSSSNVIEMTVQN